METKATEKIEVEFNRLVTLRNEREVVHAETFAYCMEMANRHAPRSNDHKQSAMLYIDFLGIRALHSALECNLQRLNPQDVEFVEWREPTHYPSGLGSTTKVIALDTNGNIVGINSGGASGVYPTRTVNDGTSYTRLLRERVRELLA